VSGGSPAAGQLHFSRFQWRRSLKAHDSKKESQECVCTIWEPLQKLTEKVKASCVILIIKYTEMSDDLCTDYSYRKKLSKSIFLQFL